jgi:hypothetical protein
MGGGTRLEARPCRAQQLMKRHADKGQIDHSFTVGDMFFLRALL